MNCIIRIEPYGTNLAVFTKRKDAVAYTRKHKGKQAAKRFKKELYEDAVDGIALHWVDGCLKCLIYLPKVYDEFITWHEALHISWYVLDHFGVDINASNHEAQTYLQEYIVRKIKEGIYHL